MKPDGSEFPFKLLLSDEDVFHLGVPSNPARDITTLVTRWLDQANRWLVQTYTIILSVRDVWLSFDIQLMPSIFCGLISCTMSPKLFDKHFQKFDFKALSKLAVNCHSNKPWQTLSPHYQGLVLPDWPIECFSSKVLFLQTH